jgi:hypothetical protein
MEVLWFLKQRTRFLRQHYEEASAPFRETIRKIEAGEDPYEPPYSEDGEPPFLEEWEDANTSLELLGASCISILSESLKLYFLTWERELGIKCTDHFPDEFSRSKGKGFVHGYKTCFGHVLQSDWSDCPVNFELIEQVVLARNAAQHPNDITSLKLEHGHQTLPFFLSEFEKQVLGKDEYGDFPWIGLTLVVTQDALIEAIEQVEMLGEWMEERLFDVKYGRR